MDTVTEKRSRWLKSNVNHGNRNALIAGLIPYVGETIAQIVRYHKHGKDPRKHWKMISLVSLAIGTIRATPIILPIYFAATGTLDPNELSASLATLLMPYAYPATIGIEATILEGRRPSCMFDKP
jgi:hypothetical protein